MDSWWNLIKKGHNQYLKNQHEGEKNSDEDEDDEENSEEDEEAKKKKEKKKKKNNPFNNNFKMFKMPDTLENMKK